jgi:hypothetical protein
MSYYERCIQRINNSNKIELEYNSRNAFFQRVVIDPWLEATQIDYPKELERSTVYIVMFKKVKVPLNTFDSESIFNMAIKRMEYLEELENQEILKDL